MKNALIIGISGQDGSYLAELLLEKQYKVWGFVRSIDNHRLNNINNIKNHINLIQGDLLNYDSILSAIKESEPNEIYNFGGHSEISSSWDKPVIVTQSNSLATINILNELIKNRRDTKYYQASTSEMFGDIDTFPQDENSKFVPRNPYGFSKLYAHWATVNYREHFGLFSVSGILYNHESPRRNQYFVTKKIVNSAVRIKLGIQNKIILGNLNAKRDWGYAPEYTEIIWKMMQQDKPEDYVIGSGEIHSVKEFCEHTFNLLDLDFRKYVVSDKKLFRKNDESILVANSSKAAIELGWKPKIRFYELIEILVKAEWDLQK